MRQSESSESPTQITAGAKGDGNRKTDRVAERARELKQTLPWAAGSRRTSDEGTGGKTEQRTMQSACAVPSSFRPFCAPARSAK